MGESELVIDPARYLYRLTRAVSERTCSQRRGDGRFRKVQDSMATAESLCSFHLSKSIATGGDPHSLTVSG